MISPSDALKAFDLLRAAGMRPLIDDLDAIAACWVATMPELDTRTLQAAVAAHIRDGVPYWPTPGQLLSRYRPSTEGEADAAWTRLRSLRAMHPGPPVDPDAPPWWRLADDLGAELLRHRIVRDLGGYAAMRPDTRETCLASAARTIAESAAYVPRYLPDGRVDPAALRQRGVALPTRQQDAASAAAAAYARTASAEQELRAIAQSYRDHGRTEHRAPTVCQPWRLDMDPATERRMWSAMQAAGGWPAVPTERDAQAADDDYRITIAEARAAFARVWRGEQARQQQVEAIGLAEPRSVAGLLARVAGQLAAG